MEQHEPNGLHLWRRRGLDSRRYSQRPASKRHMEREAKGAGCSAQLCADSPILAPRKPTRYAARFMEDQG
eukprot:CAMPEP_0174375716 /NCGR_PEP_ID=MMETSP0811_2-20130205/115607_1 /TAXON_ID=73025 ORGANISM="Eutreptiella gymnastica-like, Strain CCMP1594" /NCGR_SAMPLE_ID=MMETSP0811_2 /ASSEMBLY_ACC=CAM_ASM_000667 /LENGTH=69 /DNA_ID=CAMNT_0015526237 /DNA_START=61 /DNA_END=267 /DNA_ORIENTATION=-